MATTKQLVNRATADTWAPAAPKKASKPKPRRKPSGKKQRNPLRFWVGLSVLIALVVLVLYVEYVVEKPKPVWPEGHTVYGVDVSHYQEEVDWTKVREQEVVFTFLKATEGETLKDRYFEKNWAGAGAAGIIRGAYHFYLPHIDPLRQARNFTKYVQLQPGDLPPVLDVEKRGRKPIAQFRKELKQWLDHVENSYGSRPIIYTGYKFYEDYLAGHFDSYPLWIAHYEVPKLKIEPSTTRKLSFWQYTDRGAIEGVAGDVDCNVFYGSMRDLREVCIK